MASWQVAATLAVLLSAAAVEGATRTYYVQAEKGWWNFAEDSEEGLYIDRCTGLNYTAGAELYMQVGVGSRYLQARYVAYTDDNFTTPYEIPTEELHLGIAGPMLRVAVGDTLEVVFRNTLDFEVTFTPAGVELTDEDVEPVAMDETKTYMWNITERLSPAENETSSMLWLYSSAVDPMVHQNMGLIGPLIVTRASAATAAGRPNDTDLEFFVLYHVFDQNQNYYFNETVMYYNLTDPLVQSNLSEPLWEEANLMHSINGKMFCWNEGLVIPEKTRVRWHVASVGGEPDIHNFHWHGMVLNVSGSYVDQFTAFAGSTFDADMVPDNPGTWMFHCHINDHIHAGMVGLYTLEGTPITDAPIGDVHEYFIAANEVSWNYAPKMMDNCGDMPQPLSDEAALQLTPSNFTLNIGHTYTKALFEEYTDATFTTKKAKDPSLGFLGPTLYAKVGDTIKITYKNNARFTTGLHPHGVLYSKSSEGSPYNDNTTAAQKVDDYVHTGQTYTYMWYATERSAPGPMDGSSVVWMYHSHSHEIQDSYAGLMGAVVVTRPEMANNQSRPKDVDREYVMSFTITNEASSFMLRANLAKYFPGLPTLQYGTLLDSVPAFSTNANFHSINGFMYCNGPTFNASVGERVRFYIISLGTEADLHTPSSSLQWIEKGRRSSALINIAGGMQTADIVPQAPGDFSLQCRTAEHVAGGMIAKFHINGTEMDPMSLFNGTERTTYIAATPATWNYIPSGMDQCSGEEFDEETAAAWGDGTLGNEFLKAVYREFSDDTFKTMVDAKNPSDGIIGPTLIAEVGDMITVVFMNNLSFPANLQLSGGFIPVHNESLIDAPVEPGETVTYSWIVTAANGPAINDISTLAYSYSSNVNPSSDVNAGLFGTVVISRTGELQSNMLPVGVDYLIPLFFNILDESDSSLFDDNLALKNFTEPDSLEDYEGYAAFLPTTQWQTINGFSWCNQENVVLNASSTVRWVLVGLGGELGLHTPVFENAVLLAQGSPVHTTELAPTISMTVDMRADFVGSWHYWCNIQEHYDGGMQGIYEVVDPTARSKAGDNSS